VTAGGRPRARPRAHRRRAAAPLHRHRRGRRRALTAATRRWSSSRPNYLWRASAIPNDPLFPQLWGLHNTGQTGGTPGADIRAPQAWSVCTGSPAVIVGIIDTGIDYDHEDLAANIWANAGETPGNGVDDDGNG